MSDAPVTSAANANTSAQTPLRVAVLVSGSGSNLQVLINAIQQKALPIDIVGVISNREDAYAITRAKDAGIEVAVLSHVESGKRMGIKTFEKHATAQLEEWQPDLVVLAGFMRVLSADFIDNAPAPMINLHPSLLPAYKGLDTHTRVLRSGEREHGCSIHVVTAELDAGQVLSQAVLPIRHTDTSDGLQKRVQVLEHQLLPWTILQIAIGGVSLTPSEQASSILPALPLRLLIDA